MTDRVPVSPITLFEGICVLVYPCALVDKGGGRGGRERQPITAKLWIAHWISQTTVVPEVEKFVLQSKARLH